MSRFFLSVDPGVVHLGFAVWEDGRLRGCGVSTAKTRELGTRVIEHRLFLDHFYPCRVVCERMVTRGKFSIVDAQDLIDVNLVAGCVGTEFVTSDQWKGAVPRDVEQERTREALSLAELLLLEEIKPKSKAHNAWSAVGIGLHVLGRAHRGKRTAA
jgi:hypothetical protein